MEHPKFILRKNRNEQYFFVLTAKNGQVIAQSEMYNSKDAAENGILSVRNNAPEAHVEDIAALDAEQRNEEETEEEELSSEGALDTEVSKAGSEGQEEAGQ